MDSRADDEVQWQTHPVMNYRYCKRQGNYRLVPGFRFSGSTAESMYIIPSTVILLLFIWSRYVFFYHRCTDANIQDWVVIFIHTGTWDVVYL